LYNIHIIQHPKEEYYSKICIDKNEILLNNNDQSSHIVSNTV